MHVDEQGLKCTITIDNYSRGTMCENNPDIPDPSGPEVILGFKTGARNGIALLRANYKGLKSWHLRHCYWHPVGGWTFNRKGVCIHDSKIAELRDLVRQWFWLLEDEEDEPVD